MAGGGEIDDCQAHEPQVDPGVAALGPPGASVIRPAVADGVEPLVEVEGAGPHLADDAAHQATARSNSVSSSRAVASQL